MLEQLKNFLDFQPHGIGSVDTPFALSNVYYIPSLTMNLDSISKICDFGCDVNFFVSDCCIYDWKTQEVVGKGHRHTRLLTMFLTSTEYNNIRSSKALLMLKMTSFSSSLDTYTSAWGNMEEISNNSFHACSNFQRPRTVFGFVATSSELTSDSVKTFVTASERNRLNVTLEDSVKRWRQDSCDVELNVYILSTSKIEVSTANAILILLKVIQAMAKDSSFDLVAYTDSDYAGASLDRKSTSGGCEAHHLWLSLILDKKMIKYELSNVSDQGSGNISKTQTKATPSGLSSLRTSSEGGPGCHFTMGNSHVQARPGRLFNLPNEPPLREVKKLEKKLKHKRRREVINSSKEEEEEASLDHKDYPKQGRMIEEINKDKNVNLVKSSKQGEAHETAEHRMDLSTASQADDVESLAEYQKDAKKDKGKAIMQESESLKKIKKKEMMQTTLDEEIA
uniref:Gag-Pol polyprotein n=1 Tax=Tanacetum cinerariifolium TaxID=118510 RepID=A0A6L2JVS0_TANCI|nr:Gag-Pol polyprotein [Tanacetum cinerariifolium]